MRVVHLLKHCERGNGHVHVAVDLACEQAARGHDVVYASGGGTYVDLLERHGVHHVAVAQTARGAPAGFAALLRLVGRHRPQVVHAHMMAAAGLGYAATRARGGALVTTVHNSFDGHSGLMRLGDRVAAVSDAERRLLLGRGYRADRLTTVHNGPLGSVREALLPDGPDGLAAVPRPYAMTLSGLHGRKRVGDAIAAFAAMAADAPDWRLAVVGEGPDEAKLRAQARGLGLSGSGVEERVVFTGRTLNPGPLLRGASVFVNMAEAEPFGLVVAEARAAGCAVVATEAGGMPEVVDGGRAGILVPVGGVDAATAALRRLATEPDELARWRAAAALAPGQFTVGTMADAYEDLYAAAAAARRT